MTAEDVNSEPKKLKLTKKPTSFIFSIDSNLKQAHYMNPTNEMVDFWMIGLVLVTHGALAGEFRAAMEHVVGEQEYLITISIGPDDDMDERREEIVDAVKAVNNDKGVILLTDMFGGTPSNLAISMMDMPNVEVIAGVNLPMLIKLAAVRETLPLEEAALQVQEAGRKYISIASQVLAG